MGSGGGLAVALAVVLAIEKFALAVPLYPPNSHTYCGRATGRARLHPGWLDRVFQGLSNSGSFVGFGLVFADLLAFSFYL